MQSNVSAIQLNEHRDCGGWGGGHTRKISCLGLKSSFSKVISNVSTGQLTDVLCKYVKEIKFKSETSGILVISVRSREDHLQHRTKDNHFRIHTGFESRFCDQTRLVLILLERVDIVFQISFDGDLRMGLTMCSRSICLPFSSNGGILFGDKNDLFLWEKQTSK